MVGWLLSEFVVCWTWRFVCWFQIKEKGYRQGCCFLLWILAVRNEQLGSFQPKWTLKRAWSRYDNGQSVRVVSPYTDFRICFWWLVSAYDFSFEFCLGNLDYTSCCSTIFVYEFTEANKCTPEQWRLLLRFLDSLTSIPMQPWADSISKGENLNYWQPNSVNFSIWLQQW